MKRQSVFLAVMLILMLVLRQPACGVEYQMIRIGTFTASGINNCGQVVGTYWPDDMPRGLIWENGAITDIGALAGYSQIYANGINDGGNVVGHAWMSEGHIADGYLWRNGQFTLLGTLGGTQTSAYSINDQGQVVGLSNIVSEESHAFLWQSGQMSDLGMLGGSRSVATCINNAGQIVGYSETTEGDSHAFLWQNGIMTDLGTLGGDLSHASSINNARQIVGHSFTSDQYFHAFLWENDVMTDLETLSGYEHGLAVDINDLGQIVGYAQTAGINEVFLWEDGVFQDIGPGTPLEINNNGWIIGHDSGGAVLWKPIPEPGTLLLLGLSGLCRAILALYFQKERSVGK